MHTYMYLFIWDRYLQFKIDYLIFNVVSPSHISESVDFIVTLTMR